MTFDGHFHCDYGFSIELGVDFCANVDLVILDGAKVAIGKNCFIAPNLGTDFWRGMFYGLYRDKGHFLHQRVEGGFTAEVSVGGDYRVLYDQAGLMIRLSKSHWIKAGIEYTDGKNCFSVVVTNNMSDWALVEVPGATTDIRIRLTRHAEAIQVQYCSPLEETFVPVRLAYFRQSFRLMSG